MAECPILAQKYHSDLDIGIVHIEALLQPLRIFPFHQIIVPLLLRNLYDTVVLRPDKPDNIPGVKRIGDFVKDIREITIRLRIKGDFATPKTGGFTVAVKTDTGNLIGTAYLVFLPL